MFTRLDGLGAASPELSLSRAVPAHPLRLPRGGDGAAHYWRAVFLMFATSCAVGITRGSTGADGCSEHHRGAVSPTATSAYPLAVPQ